MATATSEAKKSAAIRIEKATGLETIRRISKGEKVATSLELDPLYLSGELEEVLWAAPIIAYSRPNQPLGTSIELREDGYHVILKIPEELRNMTNVSLALPSGSSRLEKSADTDIVIAIRDVGKISIVQNFPSKSGWYPTDPKTGIPQGKEVSEYESTARYLWRRDDGQYVGPVVRDYFLRRDVNANYRLVDGYGVALLSGAKPEAKLATKPSTSEKMSATKQLDSSVLKVGETPGVKSTVEEHNCRVALQNQRMSGIIPIVMDLEFVNELRNGRISNNQRFASSDKIQDLLNLGEVDEHGRIYFKVIREGDKRGIYCVSWAELKNTAPEDTLMLYVSTITEAIKERQPLLVSGMWHFECRLAVGGEPSNSNYRARVAELKPVEQASSLLRVNEGQRLTLTFPSGEVESKEVPAGTTIRVE